METVLLSFNSSGSKRYETQHDNYMYHDDLRKKEIL